MAADLGVDVPSWVVTGFLVTQATLLALAGRAGDLYGRRRIFVLGVLVLCAGSVLCAIAWDAPSLVAFRILQAVGACAMAPTAYAYAAELFGPRERGVALGVMGVLGLAPVLSPNIAGVLVGTLGWRSAFWFSPVFGVFVLAGAALVLVERPATPTATSTCPVPASPPRACSPCWSPRAARRGAGRRAAPSARPSSGWRCSPRSCATRGGRRTRCSTSPCCAGDRWRRPTSRRWRPLRPCSAS